MSERSSTLRPGLDHPGRLIIGLLAAMTLASASVASGAGQEQASEERPTIVATTEIVGWLVEELVGDEADVIVLMRGVDPHAWEPSARDLEGFFAADLIVANGLGLEAGLGDALEEAVADGVDVFEATDHITVREAVTDPHAADGMAVEPEPQTDHEHEHAGGDPHFWLDPLAMRDVALALAPVLGSLAVEVDERADGLVATLEALDAEARSILAVVPADARKLVTGHESMGYFADRYDFELIGAVVPGLTSQGEASAGEVADLVEAIRATGVPAIFTELGTPAAVAEAVAAETGAEVVELPTEQLPPDGSYQTFIRAIAMRVAGALAG
jgi:zinc/manganese transport system substrate-binding protein